MVPMSLSRWTLPAELSTSKHMFRGRFGGASANGLSRCTPYFISEKIATEARRVMYCRMHSPPPEPAGVNSRWPHLGLAGIGHSAPPTGAPFPRPPPSENVRGLIDLGVGSLVIDCDGLSRLHHPDKANHMKQMVYARTALGIDRGRPGSLCLLSCGDAISLFYSRQGWGRGQGTMLWCKSQ